MEFKFFGQGCCFLHWDIGGCLTLLRCQRSSLPIYHKQIGLLSQIFFFFSFAENLGESRLKYFLPQERVDNPLTPNRKLTQGKHDKGENNFPPHSFSSVIPKPLGPAVDLLTVLLLFPGQVITWWLEADFSRLNILGVLWRPCDQRFD